MNALLNVGVKAARRAGQIMLRYIDRLDRVSVEQKGFNDFVSEVDKMVEEDIVDTISHRYPQHGIIAEERGGALSRAPDFREVEWIIDPLDGTANYLHGHPQFAISIAIRENGKVTHGVIFDPLRDELYTASRGQGAQINNRRMRVTGQSKLARALLATNFPRTLLDRSLDKSLSRSVDKAGNIADNTLNKALDKAHEQQSEQQRTDFDTWMRSFRAVLRLGAGMRCGGSAALDLAYVACGRLDGYCQPGLAVWDVAAGSLLVREAGGLVADFDGEQNYLETGQIVAANPLIFNDLLRMISPNASPGNGRD